ncbi:SRPBCC family protein [Streptomyces sp. NPDC050256]|uniref:SRPBCC family protein n=1 Tax=Streptomyces sp. NPDC050256 TaxID=3365607 RepID=UPI0037A7BFF9
MTGSVPDSWPVAALDPIRRLKVIAAGSRHPTYAERAFDVPVEQLWSVVSDLETELPLLIPGLRAFTLTEPTADHLSGQAVGVFGYRERFTVVLRPGWCLMQSTLLTSGMAATAAGDGSRFAFFSAVRPPGVDMVDRMRAPWSARRSERMLDRLAERVAARSAPGRAE